MNKTILGAVFALFFVDFGFGQLVKTISGNVKSGGMIVENAFINVGKKKINCDVQGTFVFTVDNSVDEFTVVAPHFEKVVQKIGNEPVQVYQFNLSPHAEDLAEIIVRKKASLVYDVSGSNKLNAKTLREYSAQNLGDALREINGVNSLKTGNNIVKPIIHGLSGSRISMLTNRLRMEDQQWGTEHAPAVDVNGLTRINVVKNAAALQYSGDGVGGLILLERQIPENDTIFSQLTSTAQSNGSGGAMAATFVRAKEKGTSYRIDAAAKIFGDRRAADYVLSNTGNRDFSAAAQLRRKLKFGTINAELSYFQTETGILAASHIGNATDLYFAIQSQKPSVVRPFTYDIANPKQQVSHLFSQLSLEKQLGQWNSKWYYGYQRNNRKEFDIRRGNRDNIPALDLTLQSHSILADFKRMFQNTEVKLGISGGYQTNFANPDTGVRPIVPNFTKTDLGLYAISDLELNSTFRLESGIRYDYSRITASKFYQNSRWNERNYQSDFGQFVVFENAGELLVEPIFNYHNIAANAKVSGQISENYRIEFGATALNRNPNVSELFSDGLHHSSGIIEVGDLRLKQENAVKVALNQNLTWKANTFSLESFLQRIENFIYLQPTGFLTTIRGAFPVYEYKSTTARLFGADFSWTYRFSNRFSFKTAASYVSGYDVRESRNLIDIPPFNWHTSIVVKPFEKSDFTLELRHEYVAFQNAFPDFDFETNIVQNNELTQVTVPISRPPNAYQLFDLKASWPFQLQKTALQASLGIQNIGNQSYRNYLNKQRLFADELGRNITLQVQINI